MDKAMANGLNVMRAFATAVDPWYPLETSPGVYNEAMFQGLDYVLDQAQSRGIKARCRLWPASRFWCLCR